MDEPFVALDGAGTLASVNLALAGEPRRIVDVGSTIHNREGQGRETSVAGWSMARSEGWATGGVSLASW